MKIEMAKHSGFCMGVRNAVLKIVDKLNSSDDDIYVYGPLIHNPQTISVLNERGLKTIKNFDNIDGKDVAIRTHGIPIEESRKLKSRARKTYNLTCSRVGRVQSFIKKYSSKGFHIIIIGDHDHAEVIGLKSYAQSGVTVVSDKRDLIKIPANKKYLIVSQTTHERSQFQQLVNQIKKIHSNVEVIDTICDSTRLRQQDVNDAIRNGIDTLVVVGGKNSANTTRLAKLGTDNKIKTLHVETDDELKLKDFINSEYVFVTAGASTPGWIINNVLEKIYMFKKSKSNIFIKFLKTVFEFLVRSNLLSSITAFFMVLLSQKLLELPVNYSFGIIASIYIFYMYSVNNYIERDFLSKSNSYKYKIYNKYGIQLLFLSSLLVPFSIYFAWKNSLVTLSILGASYILGTVYSTATLKRFIKKNPSKIILKLYNSRIITPFGWLVVTILLPAMENGTINCPRIAGLSIFLYTIIFLRQTIIDVVAYHGDFILGRETIPTWLGMKWTSISSYTLLFLSVVLIVVESFVLGNYIYLAYIINLAYFLTLFGKLMQKNYLISLKYEFLTDLNYILFIIISLLVHKFSIII